ncbi:MULTISPECIES: 2-succinyl-5-enolpyruvyl-6-hydroxy-3-cyclohexene-1-carboxylic-acid synthase [Arthrobacter]|uniref:2-succinyl-5-enolpyruvyl-6-hydroxy-3-cyclohexene-1-carboxylate synthase n=2 Tax=Arthrobacter TaxID=1663 RepID=A0ABU9KKS4_9MICC|nr:2-succinyl-5-enolpyruvyl-6-hydroxy-3-cyclohexene-1-carboxylic-acid synthase [Arthrobacter sp. YJM1]MDP5227497.1 2-succinyl-5-enolpyruvyl-6-hydroxy-3-cyclohexene-1-carboxylic-acid synthase [Arthrobacter sp. YJM1]
MTELSALASARIVVDELLDGGVRHVVLAPGSRSAPLAYALAEAEATGRVRLHVRIDERSAAFTALGVILSSGAPAAVVVTSGTAVGNLLPAVMEANHVSAPLVVLSADRPEELRGTGASQTTDQMDLFGEHARFAVDVPAGEDPVRAVRTALSAATGAFEELPPGPVQLNLAFRDPLVPGAGDVFPASTDRHPFHYAPDPAPVAYEAPEGLEERRTLVLAGHDAGPIAEAFARAHGLPLAAEPSSNARFGPDAVGPYRLLLERFGPDSAQPVERVVVFGRPTLSRPVTALLARTDIPLALYEPVPVSWYRPGLRRETPVATLAELSAFAGRGPEGWLDAWLLAGETAQHAVERVLTEEDGLTGPAVAAVVWAATRGQLVLGSSNGIRDADLAAAPTLEPLATVHANRGIAGIDGTTSTAFGVAFGSGRETTLLCGDVTFLHDAGGLFLGAGEPEPDVRVVVLNDAGGAIFSTLEHGALGSGYQPAVERLFGTPHSIDLGALAAAYGVPHRVVSTTTELAAALAEPVQGRSVIEVRCSRDRIRELHARIRAAL